MNDDSKRNLATPRPQLQQNLPDRWAQGNGTMSILQPTLHEQLTESVMERTGRRVLELAVKLEAGLVTLSGKAYSFHVKQLALSGVRDLLPHAPLKNEIAVIV